MRTCLALLALTLTFGACSGKKSPPGMPEEVTLRLKANSGDVYTTVVTMHSDMNASGDGAGGGPTSATMDVELTKEHKCVASKEGEVTWERKTVQVEAGGTGPLASQAAEIRQSETNKKDKEVRNDRNVLVGEGEPSPLDILFPDDAIRLGDQWRGENRVEGQKVLMRYTLDNFEKVDGKTAALILAEIEGSPQIQLKQPAKIWLDVENGWPLKGQAHFRMEPQPGFSVEIKVDLRRK